MTYLPPHWLLSWLPGDLAGYHRLVEGKKQGQTGVVRVQVGVERDQVGVVEGQAGVGLGMPWNQLWSLDQSAIQYFTNRQFWLNKKDIFKMVTTM